MVKVIRVEFTKYMVSGLLEGMTITQGMPFVNWEDACKWAIAVTKAKMVPYIITEMTGPDGQRLEI